MDSVKPVINETINSEHLLEIIYIFLIVEIITPNEGYETEFSSTLYWRRIPQKVLRMKIYSLNSSQDNPSDNFPTSNDTFEILSEQNTDCPAAPCTSHRVWYIQSHRANTGQCPATPSPAVYINPPPLNFNT